MVVALAIGLGFPSANVSAQVPAAAKARFPKKPEPGTSSVPPTAPTWKEHWFEHDQVVRLVRADDEVAVYFDDNMPRDDSTRWIAPFVRQAWQYTKKNYGNFAAADPRLFVICHQGRYSGGHPASACDASHDHRSTIDVGVDPWDGNARAILAHEIGHIVEGESRGIHGSPGWTVWRDSKWAEIFLFDMFVGLDLREQAEKAYNDLIKQTDDFPRAGTHWFRDFWYPTWRDHGKAKLMPNFFRLAAENFPKESHLDGHPKYARDMNWGEFIFFMSAAADSDLRPIARRAFGPSDERDRQFEQARADFPKVTFRPRESEAGGATPSNPKAARRGVRPGGN